MTVLDRKLFAQLAVTVAIAVAGGWLGHGLSARRDFINERRKLRINYLIEAYRRLESGSNRDDNSKSKLPEIESAIADIQLLGSPRQVKLARQFAQRLVDQPPASVDDLINDLRRSLRSELNLGNVIESAAYLRFNNGGAQRYDTTLIATTKEINKAKIETAERVTPYARRRLDEHEIDNENVKKIVDTWSSVENLITERIKHCGIETDNLNSRELIRAAFSNGLITEIQLKSLLGLNEMRNLAVYGGIEAVDGQRVAEFIALANAITTVLDITSSRR